MGDMGTRRGRAGERGEGAIRAALLRVRQVTIRSLYEAGTNACPEARFPNDVVQAEISDISTTGYKSRKPS
jgi:hypothetical protein